MKDLAGERFGRLVAVNPTDRRVGDMVVWRCVCDCGNVMYAASSNLTRGRVRSCGCLALEVRSKDLTGQRFGRLEVVRREGTSGTGHATWLCSCSCGREVVVSNSALRSGKESCGECGTSRRVVPGRRFGALIAVDRAGKRGAATLWRCVSDSGVVSFHTAAELRAAAGEGAA